MIWILEWLEFDGQKRYSLWKSILISAQLADTSSWFLKVLGSSPHHDGLVSDFFCVYIPGEVHSVLVVVVSDKGWEAS